MRIKVGRRGNSLALRIPALFARETGIDAGTQVDIALDSGRIVITPIATPHALDALLAGVTEENVQGEIDSGPRGGMEAW